MTFKKCHRQFKKCQKQIFYAGAAQYMKLNKMAETSQTRRGNQIFYDSNHTFWSIVLYAESGTDQKWPVTSQSSKLWNFLVTESLNPWVWSLRMHWRQQFIKITLSKRKKISSVLAKKTLITWSRWLVFRQTLQEMPAWGIKKIKQCGFLQYCWKASWKERKKQPSWHLTAFFVPIFLRWMSRGVGNKAQVCVIFSSALSLHN